MILHIKQYHPIRSMWDTTQQRLALATRKVNALLGTSKVPLEEFSGAEDRAMADAVEALGALGEAQ